MNRKILAAEAILALVIILAFRWASPSTGAKPVFKERKSVYKNKMLMQCSPDWSQLNVDSLANSMTVLPGWGSYSWDINSRHDSAQYYFNQGINMYYAFHIIESMASFKKAQAFDPVNPMLYWAEALAYGPNINDFEYAATPGALAAAVKAKTLNKDATAKQKALIDAMQVRYSADSTISRTTLNTLYANAMRKVYNNFLQDADVAALYADALMILHPWEYWKHNGKPHPWTPEIVTVLEKNLQGNPGHPGANHYYIHVIEASPTPGKALASADRLGVMMPSVSHMVHMPSHIYIRTGHYQKGVVVNEKSINGYNQYLNLFPNVANNAPLYLIHNLHMKTTCAMMLPNYADAKKTAAECIASFDTSFMSLPQPMGNYVQYVYMIPQMVNVRYGKWDEILSAPSIPSNYKYATLLQSWASGLAYANKGDLKSAKTELEHLRTALQQDDLKVVMIPFNAPLASAKVAEKILEGSIAIKEKKLADATRHFELAVELEDALIYTEPRDWLIPSRHYYAQALILKKNYTKAQQVLEKDLEQNPSNFYALSGLATIEKAKGKSQVYATALKKAFVNSDLQHASLNY